MRPEAITDVLCLLLLFYDNSHTSCPTGWFGFQCKYKCRCTNDVCDADGECTGGHTCQVEWFGPACQYADLAYGSVSDAAVVDGNDNTCLRGKKTKVTVKLTDSFPFTWLRVKVTNQGSADLNDLTVTFSDKSRNVDCTDLRKLQVDSTTMDIHCKISRFTDHVTMDGNSAGHLCSVYISGGRNVALKENATQDSTFTGSVRRGGYVDFTADKAVDGNRDPNLDFMSCSHTQPRSSTKHPLPRWSVTMSQQRKVDRFVIFNRGDALQNRLVGFKLHLFASPTQFLYAIQDIHPQPQPVYTISHTATFIQKVAISVNTPDGIVTLCEVEIYGDSVCAADHYGRDCELECNCPDGEACVVTTGGCLSICPPGFEGPGCLKQCDAGLYGAYCKNVCSENCKAHKNTTLSPCDPIAGACLGCKSGYIGAKCDEKCSVGQFGENCSLPCSPNCVASGDANVSSCDHETGACILGCKSGWGDSCNISCSSGCAASNDTNVSLCARKTGACIMGCKSGFGDNCNSSCSLDCAASNHTNVSPCARKTGACIMGCKSGWGDTCNLPCSLDCAAFGESNTSQCNQTTGGCIMGCKNGFGYKCNLPCGSGCEASSDINISPCDQETGVCIIGCSSGFGKYCNLSCSSVCAAPSDINVSPCDQKTGACIMGCKHGFGEYCNLSCSSVCAAFSDTHESPCDPETGVCIMGCSSGFGEYCNLSCSPGCAASGRSDKTLCNQTTGVCYRGCRGGFTGKKCDSKCGVGKFGYNCNNHCSPRCAPTGDPMISPCSHETGECINGCNSGYTGQNCVAAQSRSTTKTTTSGSSTEKIAGFCSMFFAVVFLGYLLCKKRNTRSKGESAVGHSRPFAENIAY